MAYSTNQITAVILAGGQSTRVNGKNKGLLLLHKKPLIEHILSAIENQVQHIIINTNSDLTFYQQYNHPVIEDDNQQFLGPLAGLRSCSPYISSPIVITLPCDSPFIPADLVNRMLTELNNDENKLQVVNNGRQQNLFMMFHKNLLTSIDVYLKSGKRSVFGWIMLHNPNQVNFIDKTHSFMNINTLEELAKAERDTA